MKHVLAADIGGSKTLFQLADERGRQIYKCRLASQPYASFNEILSEFLAEPAVQGHTISTACLAVAGPLKKHQALVTKLPWQLDAGQLSAEFGFDKVILCNDFEAIGHGIACLAETDIETIYQGEKFDSPVNRAVIGAGTGLGEAILIEKTDGWQVLPTEGGHVDFAPTDRTQRLFLEHMQQRFGVVSYDRIVCGSGIEIIYHFLRDYKQIQESDALRKEMLNADAAATISKYASQHQDSLAIETMNVFFKIYGAQTGNLALVSIARGGIYLAGGIAAKNLDLLKHSEFVNAFLNKGRMRHIVEAVPVHVVMDEEVGLKGARLLALKAL